MYSSFYSLSLWNQIGNYIAITRLFFDHLQHFMMHTMFLPLKLRFFLPVAVSKGEKIIKWSLVCSGPCFTKSYDISFKFWFIWDLTIEINRKIVNLNSLWNRAQVRSCQSVWGKFIWAYDCTSRRVVQMYNWVLLLSPLI